MKTKIEQIESQYNAAQANKEKIQAEISEIETRLQNMKSQAEEIAASGDVDMYTEVKRRIDKESILLEVKRAMLKSADVPIKYEEARAAWDQYLKESERELNAAHDEYFKARFNLLEQVENIYAIERKQRETLKRCMELSGSKKEDFPAGKSFASTFGHDIRYFAACRMIDATDPKFSLPLVF